jgi:hypothetical protein
MQALLFQEVKVQLMMKVRRTERMYQEHIPQLGCLTIQGEVQKVIVPLLIL